MSRTTRLRTILPHLRNACFNVSFNLKKQIQIHLQLNFNEQGHGRVPMPSDSPPLNQIWTRSISHLVSFPVQTANKHGVPVITDNPFIRFVCGIDGPHYGSVMWICVGACDQNIHQIRLFALSMISNTRPRTIDRSHFYRIIIFRIFHPVIFLRHCRFRLAYQSNAQKSRCHTNRNRCVNRLKYDISMDIVKRQISNEFVIIRQQLHHGHSHAIHLLTARSLSLPLFCSHRHLLDE